MPDITLTCRVSGQPFTVTETDQAFYEKIGVPLPTLCPNERLKRRLAFRNERTLYRRNCDLCEVDIMSMFDANVPFPVYCVKCFWSDKWDPKTYAQDFDFSRPFFDQFQDLLMRVPKAATLQLNNENSEYNALIAFSRNAYMSPGSYQVEDCYYVRKSRLCKDCVNSNSIDNCELVGESTNCTKCYNSHHLINCRNCHDSKFLNDCAGCKDCFMCSGLRNKQFYFKNQKYSEEDYKKILENYARQTVEQLTDEFKQFKNSLPQRAQIQMNSENCSGDYIYNSQNAQECFDCFELEDCKYMFECTDVKDSMDLSMHDKEIELCYELSSGGEKNYNLKFSYCSCASPNSEYLYSCFYLADSFGCDGFHSRVQNCILNKQYEEEEYALLKARIIKHMKSSNEYGEFFPASMSLSAYNESAANILMPLTKQEALASGYKWKDVEPKQYASPTASVPEMIQDTQESIIKELLACKTCGKNYKIIPQELKLYKKIGIPASKRCADCRQKELDAWKNPRHLWESVCSQCHASIQTTYDPKSSHIIYCEKCYLDWVN